MALTLPARITLGALACVGSAAYAASFFHADRRWITSMACVGVAAGLSWIIFGLILLAATRRRVGLWEWVDTCLLAMALGIAIKMTGVAMNLAGRAVPLAAHIIILAIADVAMGTLFVFRARRAGISTGEGVGYWLMLNAVFAVLLASLLHLSGVLQ